MDETELDAPPAPEPVPQPPAPLPALPPMPSLEEDEVGPVVPDAELAGFLGDAYADLFGAVGTLAFKVEVELSEVRARRRGQALASLLKKYGMADAEVVAWVGLASGIACDFMLLSQEARIQKHNPPGPASAAAAPEPKERAP